MISCPRRIVACGAILMFSCSTGESSSEATASQGHAIQSETRGVAASPCPERGWGTFGVPREIRVDQEVQLEIRACGSVSRPIHAEWVLSDTLIARVTAISDSTAVLQTLGPGEGRLTVRLRSDASLETLSFRVSR